MNFLNPYRPRNHWSDNSYLYCLACDGVVHVAMCYWTDFDGPIEDRVRKHMREYRGIGGVLCKAEDDKGWLSCELSAFIGEDLGEATCLRCLAAL